MATLFETVKKGAANFGKQLQGDPVMRQALMHFGASIAQPKARGQSSFGQLLGGADSALKLAYALGQQEARSKREEKQLKALEIGAEAKRTTAEAAKRRAESEVELTEGRKRRLETQSDLDEARAKYLSVGGTTGGGSEKTRMFSQLKSAFKAKGRNDADATIEAARFIYKGTPREQMAAEVMKGLVGIGVFKPELIPPAFETVMGVLDRVAPGGASSLGAPANIKLGDVASEEARTVSKEDALALREFKDHPNAPEVIQKRYPWIPNAYEVILRMTEEEAAQVVPEVPPSTKPNISSVLTTPVPPSPVLTTPVPPGPGFGGAMAAPPIPLLHRR